MAGPRKLWLLVSLLIFISGTCFSDDLESSEKKPAQTESTSNQDSTEPKEDPRAVNAGEEYLHKATRLKITARNFGDLADVTRLCEQAIGEGLDEQNLAFAQQLLASTLFERASRVCEEIFDRNPPNDNWPTLALSARINLEDAVKHQKNFPEAYLLIGRLYLLPGGDKARAKSGFDMAIAQAAGDPPLQAMAYALRGEIGSTPKAQLDDFNAALRLQPNLTDALRARGIHYMKTNAPKKAVADFRRIATLEPEDAQIHEMLGLGLLFTNQIDESLKSFNRAIEINPESASAFAYRSRIFLDRKQLDRALEDINQAIDGVIDDLSWRLIRAQIYWQQKKYAEAVKEVERVLAVDPKMLGAIRMRAAILIDEGQMDKAIAGMERAVDALPDENDLLINLALFYATNNQTDEALEIYKKLLDRQLPHAPIYRNRGDLLLNVGRQAEAIENYNQALKLEPNDSGVLNNLAWVLATSPEDDLRDGERSLKLAKRACEVTQYKEAHILSTLAAACAENGDFSEAVRWSTEAVELGNKAVDEQLEAELKSYQDGKPWREKQSLSQDTADENVGQDDATATEAVQNNEE